MVNSGSASWNCCCCWCWWCWLILLIKLVRFSVVMFSIWLMFSCSQLFWSSQSLVIGQLSKSWECTLDLDSCILVSGALVDSVLAGEVIILCKLKSRSLLWHWQFYYMNWKCSDRDVVAHQFSPKINFPFSYQIENVEMISRQIPS